MYIVQWRIQDFPEEGRQLPKFYYFANFLPKTAGKNLDPGGPWRPFDPSMHQIVGEVPCNRYSNRFIDRLCFPITYSSAMTGYATVL